MKKMFNSVRSLDYRLYAGLLFMGFIPTLYTTLRIYFIGDMPGSWNYSIAGQLSWVNLIYEVVQEAMILPLFFFVGEVVSDKKQLANRIRTGALASFSVFALFAALVIAFAVPLLSAMAVSRDILPQSVSYIRLESIAVVFSTTVSFLLVALVSIGKGKYIYVFTVFKLVITCLTDTLLISALPFSLQLGVNGVAISNIIVNVVLAGAAVWFFETEGIRIFSTEKLDFKWFKIFSRQSALSGLESFVRNFAYMVMICRMVNAVSEQGTYWMANNFIWGWMLLPVIQLGELIKKECGTDGRHAADKVPGYFVLTAVICVLWIVLIPAYRPFIAGVLNYQDADKLFGLIMVLFVPYVFYAFQNIFDSIFYGCGKTEYMLAESIITNTVYYGIAFVLYRTGIFVPTLTGIAVMFGLGNIFDAFVSYGAYIAFTKNASWQQVRAETERIAKEFA